MARRSTWLLGAIVLAQLATCRAAPTAPLRPGIHVLTACERWARPSVLCEPGGQGAWDPTGWLLLLALAVALAALIAWLVPAAVLLARLHDHRMRE